VTCPPKFASDVENAGATYLDQPVVVDGNLVSGRTWRENTPLLVEFLRLLKANA